MKCEVVEQQSKMPKVGQFWRAKGNLDIYCRMKDREGAGALGHNPPLSGRIYGLCLQDGEVYHTCADTPGIELLQPLGGEPLKLEVVG